MNYKEISINLLFAMGDIFTILIIGGLLLLIYYWHKIHKLYDFIETEKERIQKHGVDRGVPQIFIEGDIKRMEEEFVPKLKRVERQKQEVLDFMPLFKK